ncbi:MAG: peptidase [Phycisphaerae bacterium]
MNRFRCGFTIMLVAVNAGSPRLSSGQAPGEVRPGANLVVEGIPPIPASLSGEVRRYTEFRAAALADWHPTAREMLIITRFASTAQLHRLKFPGGARTQLTFFDEPVGQARYEPKEGRYALFTRDTGGDEFAQIYRLDFADGRVTRLTDGGRSQNGGLLWNRRGDRIAYTSTRRNGADRDVYVMDPLDPGTDRLVLQVSGGGWSVLDWSPDDRRLLVGEMISANESRLWLVEADGGTKRLLTGPAPEPVAYHHAWFDPSGSAVFLTSDKDSEFQRLARLDLASGRLTPLIESIPWDIEEMALSPDGKWIALSANEAGLSKLYLYEVAGGGLTPIEALASAVVSGIEWHPSGTEFAFNAASARAPSDVYSYDVASRRLTRWTESELGGLTAGELADAKLIKWPSFDGREITGLLYQPPGRFGGRRPVLVQIHGGPESQARPTFLGRSNYFLNELGVAVIYPNVRGSTGYGKTAMKLDNGLKREDAVKDVGALLDWIGRQPDLDPDRIMVAGGSYGGYMTLATAFHYAERIRCAVDVVGISNFNTFLKNTESYRRDLRRAEYGDERDPAVRAFFERTAPLNNADRIRKPLFVIQGGNDPRVPRSEAEQIVERVRASGTPVWYLLARDEGHGFRKKENADFQFYATVMFMRQFLLAPAADASGGR